MQWLQDRNQCNVRNLNNVRLEAIRHFRNKKKAYLEAKIEELETNSKIKNIRDLYRGINDFNKVYQTRTNIVKDEKGYLFTDSHSILGRLRNFLSQLLNVNAVNGVRQSEIHATEPLVSEPNALGLKWLLKR